MAMLPTSLPSDLIQGLQTTLVSNPLEAQQKRAMIQQALLQNQGLQATLPYKGEEAHLANELTGQQIQTAQVQRGLMGAQTGEAGAQAGYLGAEEAAKRQELAKTQLLMNLFQNQQNTQQKQVQQNPIQTLSQPQPAGGTGPMQGSPGIPGLQGGQPMQNPETPDDAFARLQELTDQASSPVNKFMGYDMSGKVNAAQRAAEAQMDKMLASPKWKAIADAVGTSKIKSGDAIKQFRAEVPGVTLLPTAQQKLDVAFPANPQPNNATFMNQPIASEDLDYYGHQLATSGMSQKELMSDLGSRMSGAARSHAIVKIQQLAQKEDPTYSPAKNEADAAYFSNPKVRTTMAQIQQAYQTVQALNDSFSKIDNGQYPTLNKWAQAFQNQAGDANATIKSIQSVIGQDEISTALSRTGTNTDKVRGLAAELADMNRSPAQQAEASKLILQALGRTMGAYKTMMGGFGNSLPNVGADTSGSIPTQKIGRFDVQVH